MKKIEKVVSFRADRIETIIIVGCGGNGSHLVSDVSRYIATSDKELKLILIDGDHVEEKNIIRQNFITSDIGKNKAEVLAQRYSAAFGIEISSIPEYLTPEVIKGSNFRLVRVLWVTCTDNLKSRKLVDGLQEYKSIWVDLGNEEFGGQVTLSCANKFDDSQLLYPPESLNESTFRMPSVFELFPEYNSLLEAEEEVIERSCAEIAEESPAQAGFINATCAMIAKNWIHALLEGNPISTHQVYFTIKNVFSSRSIYKSTIEGWRKNLWVK